MNFKPALKFVKNLKRFQHKYVLPFAIGLIIILGPIIYFLVNNPETARAWYDDNWQYRVKYTLKNTGATVNNQKVKLDINTSALIEPGKMQTACQDSRFTDANGSLLKYYMDTDAGACNTESTDFYVLLPTINTGDTVIYHYYGAPYADFGSEAENFSEVTFSPTSTAVASEQTGPGPVAYWKFDEGFDKKYDTKVEQQIEIMNAPVYSTSYYPWFNESWAKRQLVTVTNNTAVELTDFQTQLSVTYDSDMQADFDDLRFTDPTGTELSYWIESKTDGVSAVVWVKVPSIPASGSISIAMYYGNEAANTAASKDDTMILYDDFEDSILDPKWTQHGDTGPWAETGGTLRVNDIDGVDYSYMYYQNRTVSNTDAFVVEARIKLTNSAVWQGYTLFDDGTTFHQIDANPTRYGDRATSTAMEEPEVPTINNDGTWYNIKLIYSPNTLSIYHNGTLAYSDPLTGTMGSSTGYIGVSSNYYSGYAYWDYLKVRKYASSEPSVLFELEEEKQVSSLYYPTDNSLGIIGFNPEDYNGETVYLESIVSTDNATWTRERSNPIEMPAGTKTYTVRVSAGNGVDTTPKVQLFNITDNTAASSVTFGSVSNTSVYIKSARLIINQSSATGITQTSSSVELGSPETISSTSYVPLTDKKIYDYDANNYDPAPNTFLEAAGATSNTDVKIEQYLEITNTSYTTNSITYVPTDNSLGRIKWDGTKYSDATVYLEAVLYNLNTEWSNTARAMLYDTNGNAVSGAEAITSAGGWSRPRSGAIPLGNLVNGTEYTVRTRVTNNGCCNPYSVTIKAARLVIVQSNPEKITKTQTSIGMSGLNVANGSTPQVIDYTKVYLHDSSKFDPAPTSTYSAVLRSTRPTITQYLNIVNRVYNSSNNTYLPTDNTLGTIVWDGTKYSDATVYLEAIINNGNTEWSNTARVMLYDTSGNAVGGSQATTGSGGWSRVRSSAIPLGNLVNGREYTVRISSSNSGSAYTVGIKSARLVIIQSNAEKITDTETSVDIAHAQQGAYSTGQEINDKTIYYYDQSKFNPTPTINFEANIRSTKPTIEQHLEITNKDYTALSTSYVPTDNSIGIIGWDSTRYSNATVYLETVVRNWDTAWSNKAYTMLYDTDGNPVAGSQVTHSSGGWSRARSGAIPLSNLIDGKSYTVRTKTDRTAENNQTTVRAARLVIIQSDTAKITDTQTSVDIGGSYSTTATSYEQLAAKRAYNYDSSKFTPGPFAYFEAALSNDTAGQTSYAALFVDDGTCTSQVADSEVSVTGTAYTRVRSNAVTLTSGTDYTVCVKGSGNTTRLLNAKVILAQSDSAGITELEILHQQVNKELSDADEVYSSQVHYSAINNQLEPNQVSFAGGQFQYYFEANMKATSGTAYARTNTYSNSEVTTGNLSYTRVRSSEFTSQVPTYPSTYSSVTYDTQIRSTGTNTSYISASWVVIQVSNLATEQITAYAELYNITDGTVVAGSTVSTTETAWDLVKTSTPFTLTTGKEYSTRLRTNHPYAHIAVNNARILLSQSNPTGITHLEIPQQQVNRPVSATYGAYTAQVFYNRYNYDVGIDQLEFSGARINFSYEATMKASGGSAYATINSLPGTEITTSSAEYTRVRSGDITAELPAFPATQTAVTLDTHLKGTGVTSVSNSWVVIQVADLATETISTYAELFNQTDGVAVTNSQISTTNASWTYVSSGNITLDTNKEYVTRVYSSNAGAHALIADAKLYLYQEDAEGVKDLEIIQDHLSIPATASTASYVRQNYFTLFNPANFQVGEFSYAYEAVLKTNAGTGYVQLVNTSDNAVIAGTELSTSNTSLTRVRSGDISSGMPQAAKNFDIQIKNAPNNSALVATSSLVIQVRDLGIKKAYVALFENGSTCTNQVPNSAATIEGDSVYGKSTAQAGISSGSSNGYMVCIKTLPGVTLNLTNAKVIHQQTAPSGITRTRTYQSINTYPISGNTSTYVSQGNNNLFDRGSFTGSIKASFEATLKTAAGTGYVQLYDKDSGQAVSGSEVQTASVNYARVASNEISSLTSTTQLGIQVKNSATNQVSVSGSLLALDITNEVPSIAYDTTENHLNGAVTDVSWEQRDNCISGSCVKFDSAEDEIVVNDSRKLDFGASDSFTISGWFTHSYSAPNISTLLAKFEETGSDGGYKIYMNKDGTLTFGISDTNTDFPKDFVTTSESLNDNQWHHLVAMKNGSTSISLYIDGDLVGSDTELLTVDTLANNDSLYIGVGGDGSSYTWSGLIDELKIYPYVRSDQEINADLIGTGTRKGTFVQLGQNANTKVSNGLLAYWKMDESTSDSCSDGSDSCDSSGNLVNGTWVGDTSSTPGKVNSAVSLDGVDDRVTVGIASDWYTGWDWYNSSWAKRRLVTITNNTASGVTDYPVNFNVEYSAGMQPDFDDLTFTDINSQEVLNYWLESKTDGVTASVWLKIPGISANSATNVYMYYGNSEAVSTSDGSSTFPYFDTFDTDKGYVRKGGGNGTYSITDSTIVATETSAGTGWDHGYEIFPSIAITSGQLQVWARFQPTVNKELHGIAFCNQTNNASYFYKFSGSQAWGLGTELSYSGSGLQKVYFNLNDFSCTGNLMIGHDADTGANAQSTYDWIFVKSYLSSEPTVAVSTGEESYNTLPSPLWTNRIKITFDNSGSGEDLTDFPVLVKLNSSRISYAKTQDSGQDIRFLDADGSTTLSHEIEKWDENGESIVWVKIPNIPAGSTDDFIYLYYNNPNAFDTQNPGGVWNTGYNLIYHMEETPGAAVTNSINATNGGTPSGSMSSDTTSPLGQAWQFSSSFIDTTYSLYLGNTDLNTTISFWAKGSGEAVTTERSSGDNGDAEVLVNSNGTMQYRVNHLTYSPYQSSATSTITSDTTQWNMYSLVINGASDSYKFYINGVEDTKSLSFSNGQFAFSNIEIGRWRNSTFSTSYFSGSLDEIRISNIARSASWATAEYLTTSDTFNSYGTQQSTNSPIDSLNNQVTASAWINASTLDTNRRAIISRGDTPDQSWYIQTDPTNPGKLTYSADGGTNVGTSQATLTTDTWNHVIMTAGNGKTSLYINGLLDSQTDFSGTVGSGGDLGIGNDPSGGTGWAGKIDEVRVYNIAFDETRASREYSLSASPIAYWDFNEGSGTTLFDKSGNNLHTDWSGTGDHWTVGKYGKGGSFNGTNDYFNVPGGLPAVNTISFWINPGTESTPLINLNDTANIQISSGTVTATGITPSATYVNGVLSDQITLNTWQHIAIVTDTPISATSINVGKVGSSYYLGNMDDLRFYGYARTISQTIRDMNIDHPLPGSPVGSPALWLKMDEGYGDTAHNSGNQGLELNAKLGEQYGACPENTTCPTWTTSGKFDKALSFNGDTNYLLIPDHEALKPTHISYFSWVKLDTALPSQPRSYPAIVSKRTGSYGFAMYFFKGDQEIQISLGNGTSKVTSETVVSAYDWTKWHYIGFTHDGANLKIYIDGQLVDTEVRNFNIAYDTTDLWIGRITDYSASTIDGSIDEVKLYNFALEDDQVVMDYNRSKAFNMGALSTEPDGASSSESASRAYCVPGDTSTCRSPVAEWSFDTNENGFYRFSDLSGNNINLNVMTASGQVWERGRKGNAFLADGFYNGLFTCATYIDTENSVLDITDSITLETWIKNIGNPELESTGPVISKSGAYSIQYDSSGNLTGTVWVNGTPVSTPSVNSSLAWDTQNWNHWVFVYDGNKIQLYKNGTKIVSDTSVTGDLSTNNSQFMLGSANGGEFPYFKGLYDDVKVYDYARTPAQIAWDYNKGEPIGWWRLDECQGSTLHDVGVAGKNGAINIGAEGTNSSAGSCESEVSTEAWSNGAEGRFNGSLSLDGDDYVVIGTDSSLKPATALTFSMWIKPSEYPADYYAIGGNSLSGSAIGYLFDMGTTNLNFQIGDGTWTAATTSSPALNTWTHITGTWDGSNVKLYVNGLPVDTVSKNAINYTNTTLDIGRYGNHASGNMFKGQIDDVRLYNYALTDYQVKQIFNGGAAVRFD